MTQLVVTGASGFIGSHLCAAAVARGFEVTAVGHSVAPRVPAVRHFSWDEFVRAQRAKGAICCHLGEQGNIACFNRDGERYSRESMNGVHALMEKHFSRLVYASTCAVYRASPTRCLSEEDPVYSLAPYVRSKLDVEQEVASISGFNLRLANVYGPGMSANTIIPTLITQLLGPEESVVIRCTTDERDFIYVQDVIDAFFAVFREDAPAGTYNISTGVRTSIAQLYQLLEQVQGRKKPLRATEGQTGTSLALSPEKARRLLGWYARTSLVQGLRMTFEGR